MLRVPVGINIKVLQKSNYIQYVCWDLEKFPHMVITGSTGSGKTYGLKALLGRIGKYYPDTSLILCDYKSDKDFDMFKGVFRFNDCKKGLSMAVNELEHRQKAPSINMNTPYILVFDEWAAFLSSLEKKDVEAAKSDLGKLLMLGRSFRIFVILSQQRADSSFFAPGVRDNFNTVISMGRISKEAVGMFFSDYKETINPNMDIGQGNALIGGQHYEILIPQINNISMLNKCIQRIIVY